MAKKFHNLVKDWKPERTERVMRQVRELEREMHLAELRRAREQTQEALANQMSTDQSEISRIEHRADLYLSTLRRYVEALGASLHIVAEFDDGEVFRLTVLSEDPRDLTPEPPHGGMNTPYPHHGQHTRAHIR